MRTTKTAGASVRAGVAMRRFAISLAMALSFGCFAAPAVAQDRTAPRWAGAYIGLHLGGAWLNGDAREVLEPGVPGSEYLSPGSTDAQAVVLASKQVLKDKSLLGGAQVGYNFQFGRLVAGVEADISALNLRATESVTRPYPVNFGSFSIGNSVSADWLATIRARLGVTHDRSLIYVTGGVAFADVEFTRSFSDTIFITPPQTATDSALKTGWTLGGGLEFAWTSQITIKGEYLHVDLGSLSNRGIVGASGFTNPVSGHATIRADIARLGLNFRF